MVKKKTRTPRPQCLVQPCSFEWGQMEITTCKFAYYVKHSSLGPAIATHRPFPLPFMFQHSHWHLYLYLNLTYWLYNCYRVLLLLLFRCVCCVQCGSNSPGFHCEWQNNYTHCGPCASLVSCPVCRENFMEEELLLQCQYCDRWVLLIRTTHTRHRN